MGVQTNEEPSLLELSVHDNWHAWINLMPPPPNDLHVVGDVTIPNLGVDVILTPHVPQGVNPTILLLDLILIQKPGRWAQVRTLKEAKYDKVVFGSPYRSVQILFENHPEPIIEIPVMEIN